MHLLLLKDNHSRTYFHIVVYFARIQVVVVDVVVVVAIIINLELLLIMSRVSKYQKINQELSFIHVHII